MAVPMTSGLESLSAALLRAPSTVQAVAVRRAMLTVAARAPEMIRRSALDTLPKAGGANEWVADSVTRVTVTGTSRTTVTVRTHGRGQRLPKHLKDIDRGILRHPNYGHRSSWSTTRVRPGFFTRPMERDLTPQMTVAMREAAVETARSVTRG